MIIANTCFLLVYLYLLPGLINVSSRLALLGFVFSVALYIFVGMTYSEFGSGHDHKKDGTPSIVGAVKELIIMAFVYLVLTILVKIREGQVMEFFESGEFYVWLLAIMELTMVFVKVRYQGATLDNNFIFFICPLLMLIYAFKNFSGHMCPDQNDANSKDL